MTDIKQIKEQSDANCWRHGREEEAKLTIIGVSVFSLIFAVALGVSAWAFMSEAT